MYGGHSSRSHTWTRWLLSLMVVGSYGLGEVVATSRIRRNAAGGSSFHIEQVEVKGQFRNLAMEVRQTHHKYGIPMSEEMAAAGSANISANPENRSVDRVYLTPIQVGTPAQSFNVHFDTGSSDLWLFSSELPKKQIKGQSIFQINQSSTWALIDGATFNISYQDGGGASGIVGTDVVSVGGLTANNQGVEAANKVSKDLTKDSLSSGIVGLAFSSGNTVVPNKQQTFFDSIAGSLNQKVFCADLRLHMPGSFSFGVLDTSAYTGFVQYIPVDSSQSAWSIGLTGYAVSGVDSDFNPIQQSAIVDTGTSAIFTDPSIVSDYWGSVSGSSFDNSTGLYKYPCKTALPGLNFRFVGSPDNNNPESSVVNILPKYLKYKSAKGSCYGALVSNAGNGQTILGDPWFKSQYTCFDQSTGTPRIAVIIKDQNW